jgi:hypothetical protein
MRILLDECLPKPLKRELQGHVAHTVTEASWSGIKNGALLRLAEVNYDIFLTVDRSIEYQQTIAGLNIAVILLIGVNNRLETLRPLMPQVLDTLETIQTGQIVKIGGY